MEVVFLALNARYTHVNLASYYLNNYITQPDISSIIFEKNINENVLDIMSDIFFLKPDVLCISCYIWNQSHVHALLKDIKKVLPKLIIVCGGPDISYNSQDWLDLFPSIDIIVQGPGEYAMHYLQLNKFKHDEKILKMDNFPLKDIDIPYHLDNKSRFKNRYLYYEASRGCPCSCSYCISSIESQQLEYKDFKKIKEEILYLLQFDPLIIKFVDRTFNANNKLCIQIWDFISKINTNTKFHFEINPHYITDEQIEIFCILGKNIQIEIGVQTLKQETLKLIDRKGSVEDFFDNICELESDLVHKHMDMIVGLPGESYSDIIFTFNKLLSIFPDHLQVGFLKLLPGTKLALEANKWGYKYQSEAPYRILSSNTLSFLEILHIELVEMAIDLIYNSNIMIEFNMHLITELNDLYSYYRSLGTYMKINNINKSVTDRKKLFQVVKLHFDNYEIDDKKDTFYDLLRYDWFIAQDTHYYPDFLKAEVCDNLKTKIYVSFKNKWQESNHKLKLPNAVFYAFQSDDNLNDITMDFDGIVKVKDVFYFVKHDTNSEVTKIEIKDF